MSDDSCTCGDQVRKSESTETENHNTAQPDGGRSDEEWVPADSSVLVASTSQFCEKLNCSSFLVNLGPVESYAS